MKIALLITSLVYIASAVPMETQRISKVSGLDHQTIQVDSIEPPTKNNFRTAGSSRNSYLLFTRNSPRTPQSLFLDDAASILNSNYNPRWATVAICHGYTQAADSTINQIIRDAYLGLGDYNVIVLDWSHTSQLDYFTAISSVPSVGQHLGALLLFINQVTGAPLESMHVVGFSLGAHVAGNAGRSTGGRVGRVTGLDPVSPVWALNNNRLTSSDGVYVENIHTYGNSGSTAYGDVDFYVNGGGSQPGCLLSLCSHNRSWEIFAATVTHNHLVGRRCDGAVAATCSGPELRMGNADVNKSGSGRYYVSAERSYPY